MPEKKAGDFVMIYEDPITKQKEEGVAKLVTKIEGSDHGELERWTVRFVMDGYECDRWIDVEQELYAKGGADA